MSEKRKKRNRDCLVGSDHVSYGTDYSVKYFLALGT